MTNIFYLASKTKYQVKGLNLENFLFNLTSAGISVQKIKRKQDVLTFVASSVNNSAIIACAHNLGIQIKIIGVSGLIKFIKHLPYCIGSILGIIYSIFCVWHFTTFAISIEYIVPQNHVCLNKNDCIFSGDNFLNIKKYISDYFNPNVKVKTNINQLQNAVIAKFKNVENCSIQKNGNRIIISLTEAVAKNNFINKQIVAPQNCIIYSITTLSGKAIVKAGDVVTKGQVLVEGENNILPRANIVAKVWYVSSVFHNTNQTVLKETGNKFITTSIEIFNKQVLKNKECPFKYYRLEQQSNYITNMLLPIKKNMYTFYELQLVNEYVSFESVKTSVLEKAKQDSLNKTSGSPLECTYSIVSKNNMVRVDCFLLVEEQIGTE